MDELKKVIVEDLSIKADCQFARAWLFSKDELVAISKAVFDKWSPYCILESSFLEADDLFGSGLTIKMFQNAAAIELSPTGLKVSFSQMETRGNLSLFSSSVEFIQNEIVKKDVSMVSLNCTAHAKFSSKSDHLNFMKQYGASDSVISGGFVLKVKGVEGSGDIRIMVEQSERFDLGIFIGLRSKLNAQYSDNGLKLLSQRVDEVLQSKGLSLEIQSGD